MLLAEAMILPITAGALLMTQKQIHGLPSTTRHRRQQGGVIWGKRIDDVSLLNIQEVVLVMPLWDGRHLIWTAKHGLQWKTPIIYVAFLH